MQISYRMLLLFAVCWPAMPVSAARDDGVLTLNVANEQTGEPLAARLKLTNARGRPVRTRPEGAAVLKDGIYFAGDVALKLPRGEYQFLLEAGPEYRTRPGRFTISRRSQGEQQVTLLRRVDMVGEGYRAGDLDVQLPLDKLLMAMTARGVHFAPATTIENDAGRCRTLKAVQGQPGQADAERQFGPWAALDHRSGGSLLLVGGKQAYDVCKLAADASSLETLRAGRDAEACNIAVSPCAWDLPLWVASGQLDAIAIVNRFTGADRARDKSKNRRLSQDKRYRGRQGEARWGEAIFHHLLNCGIRIPPAAGSGAGANNNPIGANRTYVHCGETFSPGAWLAGLKAGRTFVTNGPLLRTQVQGHPPGRVFELEKGETRDFQIALNLAFYEQAQVDYLEIIKDGTVAHEVRLDELAKQAGQLPPVSFDGSGWFLVRAVTNEPAYYQFASTGPYYVEANYEPRISRQSVQFFLDWISEAEQRAGAGSPAQAEWQAARRFWQDLFDRANAP